MTGDEARVGVSETTEEEKGKLGQARDAFAGLGRDIVVGVLTAYAAQASGASQ